MKVVPMTTRMSYMTKYRWNSTVSSSVFPLGAHLQFARVAASEELVLNIINTTSQHEEDPQAVGRPIDCPVLYLLFDNVHQRVLEELNTVDPIKQLLLSKKLLIANGISRHM